MKCSIIHASALVFFVLLSGIGLSNTIHVPADHATIQAAIDAASNGDSVLVAAGTYGENINFYGKAVTVKSVSGAASTVIDGSTPLDPVYTSVVTFWNGEGLDSVLDGFTLTGGTGYLVEFGLGIFIGYGGGILCDGASPTLINNIIRENGADLGSGILCQNGSAPLIEGNTITENDLESNANGGGISCRIASSPIIRRNEITFNRGFFGAGIFCDDGSSPLIEDSVISGNVGFWGGGGIFCRMNSSPTISKSTIYNNRCSSGIGGGIQCENNASPIIERCVVSYNWAQFSAGGLYCYLDCSPQISNCLFFANKAHTLGGAFFFSTGGNPSITNCTVADNIAIGQGRGGAIYCYSDITLAVTNSIFWENEALTPGKEIFIGYDAGAPCQVSINYSDLQGGLSSVYLEAGSTLNWGAEMVDEDPLFADEPNDDFHLTYPSPCLNAGDDTAVTEPFDLEDDPRIAYGAVDMGADEFHPHLYYTGAATPSWDVEMKFIGLPGDIVNGLIIGVNIFDPPLPCDYGLWFMDDPFQIITGLGLIPAEGVLVLAGTIPTAPPAPYTVYFQGVIDMGLTNLSTMNVE